MIIFSGERLGLAECVKIACTLVHFCYSPLLKKLFPLQVFPGPVSGLYYGDGFLSCGPDFLLHSVLKPVPFLLVNNDYVESSFPFKYSSN